MNASIICTGCNHSYAETALFCPNCGRPKIREAVVDPLLGKVLGERFLVQEQLGHGGSGTIYRAEHVTLRRKVAIKVLHNELSRDDLAVERFRREATTVAEIDNEHIVEIHDFGRTPDGRLYLAMELLEGETLDSVLARDKQLSVERTADILIQVGEAMMEAHAIGYVHRDLRPRNIYLAVRRGKANFVKLLDFGLAKLVETEGQAASTSLGMTFGDPKYMSPEQARGDRIDRRADIYQLGCVAYEMLTGAPPFSGNRVFDILTKQVTEAPQPLPSKRRDIPLWMEAAVAKMLAKDPANRFATTTRMVEALRRGLETGEVMEDEIARRRESIPPPSVSRVMQKLGIQQLGEPPAQEPLPAPLPPSAPVVAVRAPVVPAAPASAAASGPMPAAASGPIAAAAASAAASGPIPTAVDPAVTMRAPVAPAPVAATVPDSVELLRKRTGTPRVGVPVVNLPEQSPVAGVIEPEPKVEVRADAARPSKAPLSTSSIQQVAGQHAAGPNAGESHREGPTSSSKRGSLEQSDLNLLQVWYDEGEQLGDESGARKRRPSARKSPGSTDVFYDELPRRRRWGLFAGIGAVVVLGGGLTFALTRGGSGSSSASLASRDKPQPAITAPIDAAPSVILPSEPTGEAAAPPAPAPTAVAPAPTPAPTAPPTAAPAPARVAVATPPAPHAPVGTKPIAPVPAPRNPGARTVESTSSGFPVLGSEPSRRPGGASPPAVSSSPPAPVGPVGPSRPTATGVTDGPRDPYADEPAPSGSPAGGTSDGVTPEKKAEFFANVGSQQLNSGDTASAAANFKKSLELDPRNVAATVGMGEIAVRQGLFGDAIAHLSKAVKMAPKNTRALTMLGEAYLRSGNNALAAANFKKALQLDPDNAAARDGYNEASSRVPAPSDDN